MLNTQAKRYVESAIKALSMSNTSVALRDLTYAAEEWPDQCDLHRALAFCNYTTGSEPVTSHAHISAIADSLATFDELVSAIDSTMRESAFATTWNLPVMPLNLRLATRGQVRCARAGQLIAAGDFDGAAIWLDAAASEPCLPDNTAETSAQIAATRTVLFVSGERWSDVIDASAVISTPASNSDSDRILAALGNAAAGAALCHLGAHDAGREKLVYAIGQEFPAVSAWACWKLGLSHRATGDETAAQKALSTGLKFSTDGYLQDAMRNKNIHMRITAPDVIAARTDYWDPSTEPDPAEHQRLASQDERKEVLAGSLDDLETLDGMVEVKDKMRSLAAEIRFDNELRRRGKTVKPKTRHLVFTGPPGTGKTTIANMIVDLYYGLGVIRTKTLIPANRAALVGAVEGESAKKTLEQLKNARGGVLFIDEAYELLQDRGGQADPFGSEALTTLLEYMDNHRDDLIVIIAGYEQNIERFIRENPGLKSRFSETLRFTTYTPEEMWRILLGMAAKDGRTVDASIETKFREVVDVMWGLDARGERVLDVAGNGRFARNVYEQAQSRASKRMMTVDLSQLSDEAMMELTGEDVLGAMGSILAGFGITHVL